MNPTEAQLQNRMNPTPVTVSTPRSGLFTIDRGETLYIRTPQGLTEFDIVKNLLTQEEKKAAGNYGDQLNVAKRKLFSQYGLNVDSLPKANLADVYQQLAREGFGGTRPDGAYQPPVTLSSNIQDFLQAPKASFQSETLNTEKPVLGQTVLPPTPPTPINPTGAQIQQIASNPAYNQPVYENKRVTLPSGLKGYTNAKNEFIVGEPPVGTVAPEGSTGMAGATGSTPAPTSANIEAYISSLSLPEDQKALLRAMGTAYNDPTKVQKLKTAIDEAMAMSDPYFKAQARLVTTALDNALNASAQDETYQATKLKNSLDDLQKDLAVAKNNLTLDQANELKALERKQAEDLDTLQNNLAASGFGASSIRAKKEQFMNESYGDIRESTNRQYATKLGEVDTKQTQATRDYALELQRLHDLTTNKNTLATINAEEKVGSAGLGGRGVGALPDLTGSLAYQQSNEAFGNALKFIF